jgi:hypothetical protein
MCLRKGISTKRNPIRVDELVKSRKTVTPAPLCVRDKLHQESITSQNPWIPAFAGMTKKGQNGLFTNTSELVLVKIQKTTKKHSNQVIYVPENAQPSVMSLSRMASEFSPPVRRGFSERTTIIKLPYIWEVSCSLLQESLICWWS